MVPNSLRFPLSEVESEVFQGRPAYLILHEVFQLVFRRRTRSLELFLVDFLLPITQHTRDDTPVEFTNISLRKPLDCTFTENCMGLYLTIE